MEPLHRLARLRTRITTQMRTRGAGLTSRMPPASDRAVIAPGRGTPDAPAARNGGIRVSALARAISPASPCAMTPC